MQVQSTPSSPFLGVCTDSVPATATAELRTPLKALATSRRTHTLPARSVLSRQVRRRVRDQKSATFSVLLTTTDMKSKQRSRHFPWALLYTAAQRTVIGEEQARQYYISNNILRTIALFQQIQVCIRRDVRNRPYEILIPTPGSTNHLSVGVVPEDGPLLVGLDVMDRHHLRFLSVSNELECASGQWPMPVPRKSGHAYMKRHPIFQILYTRSQLIRLHKNLLQSSVQTLYNLLRRVTTDKLSSDTR